MANKLFKYSLQRFWYYKTSSIFPITNGINFSPLITYSSILNSSQISFNAQSSITSLENKIYSPSSDISMINGGFQKHKNNIENEKSGPIAIYNKGKQTGIYRNDNKQDIVIYKLQELYTRIKNKKLMSNYLPNQKSNILTDNRNHSISNWLFFNKFKINKENGRSDEKVQGLYLHGGVGTGKTMLMDLFVHSSPPEFKIKRIHFHDFMLDIHAQLHRYNQERDPLIYVAMNIVKECNILALDEFFVTDVADAMILHRLFGCLWDNNVVLLATSNRPPDDLYAGGLQRDLFLPFIHRLKDTCVIHNLNSDVDYRKLAHLNSGFFIEGKDQKSKLKQCFYNNTTASGPVITNKTIPVKMGRYLNIPFSSGPLCFFTFDNLCNQPLGSADYFALTSEFHTLYLEDIPIFTYINRSAGYRFITLIDILYDNKIRLVCSADVALTELFSKIKSQDEATKSNDDDIVVDDNLAFAKDRTISRLIEMQSIEYRLQHAHKHAPELILALTEINTKKLKESKIK